MSLCTRRHVKLTAKYGQTANMCHGNYQTANLLPFHESLVCLAKAIVHSTSKLLMGSQQFHYYTAFVTNGWPCLDNVSEM